MTAHPDHHYALPVGHQLGDYEILSILGHGGFGITYLAEDIKLKTKVAIKEYLPADIAVRTTDLTVRSRTSDDDGDFAWGLDRFLKEAQTLARFNHPNIVGVRRFFEDNGTAYMVMDYQEGDSLSSVLARHGRLEESEIFEILAPLLDGLEAVHAADILHRDIKPGNIYIRNDGSPVLLDFGAARTALGQRSMSLHKVFTPGYAPAEQYETSGHQGPWTDHIRPRGRSLQDHLRPIAPGGDPANGGGGAQGRRSHGSRRRYWERQILPTLPRGGRLGAADRRDRPSAVHRGLASGSLRRNPNRHRPMTMARQRKRRKRRPAKPRARRRRARLPKRG